MLEVEGSGTIQNLSFCSDHTLTIENQRTMPAPLLTELPYRPDSAALFETIADWPWAVFLDSGRHHPGQSRYDILSAQP